MSEGASSQPKGKAFDRKLFGRVMVFVRPYQRIFWLSLLLTIVLSGLGVVRPLIMGDMIDGYALTGDLYDLGSNKNLTEARRRELRREMLAAVPDSQTLVFSPKDPKYTISVFTDVDCGYCRKLHSQIAEYNRLGVRVRYLFFPRSGPDTESWHKAESVWCSADRNDALTRAKRGETLKAKPCGPTPVAKEHQLGEDIGVQGTPSIVLANGEMLPGYVPPAMLVDHLKSIGR